MGKIAALLLLTGCAAPIPVRVFDGKVVGRLAELPEEVEDACAILGLACESSKRTYGSITLEMVETEGHEDRVLERAFDDRCKPHVRANHDPRTIAHGFGHVFELVHTTADDRLMARRLGGVDLTDAELDTISEWADKFVNCR